jgi:hypothetical protein
MGVDYEKCPECHECMITDRFPICFCCENRIDGLCRWCVSSINCVDKKQNDYLCNDCLENASNDDIESGGGNYHVKNIKSILKVVKKLRKSHFTKELKLEKLQANIDRCNKEIDDLQKEIVEYKNLIEDLK